MNPDIRWVQRFGNYKKALKHLNAAVELGNSRELTELEQQGLIKGFEFTYELAWNLLKDYLKEQGFTDFHGSKDTIRIAFREGLLDNGQTWMDMVKSRNESSHTYDTVTVNTIVDAIVKSYIDEFRKLNKTMDRYYEECAGNADG